jgi:hypothetical protein
MAAAAAMPDGPTLADVQVAVVDIMAERVQVVADAQVAVVDAQVAADIPAADIPAADIQAVADPDNRINLTATQLRPRHLCRGLSFHPAQQEDRRSLTPPQQTAAFVNLVCLSLFSSAVSLCL